MKVVMTQEELALRIVQYRKYGDDAVQIAKDPDAPSGYALVVSVGNGDEFIPITITIKD